MTPILNYLIFLTLSGSVPLISRREDIVGIVNANETAHTFTVRTNGSFLVGVAARNAVGRSDVAYYQPELSEF